MIVRKKLNTYWNENYWGKMEIEIVTISKKTPHRKQGGKLLLSQSEKTSELKLKFLLLLLLLLLNEVGSARLGESDLQPICPKTHNTNLYRQKAEKG